MNAETIAAFIAAAAAIIVSIISNSRAQAVTQTKLDGLAREVREYKDDQKEIVRTIPQMQEQIKVINHRLAELECALERRSCK